MHALATGVVRDGDRPEVSVLRVDQTFCMVNKILVLVMQYMIARWRVVLQNYIFSRAKRGNF